MVRMRVIAKERERERWKSKSKMRKDEEESNISGNGHLQLLRHVLAMTPLYRCFRL